MQNKSPTIFKGAILSIILCLILSAILALLVSKTDIYGKSEAALTFLITVIPVMAGAFSASKVLKEKGLITGLLLSLIYYIIMLAVAFVIKGSTALSAHTFLMLTATLLSGMAGGVIGMPR